MSDAYERVRCDLEDEWTEHMDAIDHIDSQLAMLNAYEEQGSSNE